MCINMNYMPEKPSNRRNEPAIMQIRFSRFRVAHTQLRLQINMASTEEVLVWTPELEVSLFHSMKGHKPVGKRMKQIQATFRDVKFFVSFFLCFSGINRHFHMACIHDKFATSTGKRNISSKQIWEHLQELYNLQALVSV